MDVWVFGTSRIVVQGVSRLVEEVGFKAWSTKELPAAASVGLWVPSHLSYDLPAAPAVPTLVVFDAGTRDLVELLQRGYRGSLMPSADRNQMKLALEAVSSGEIWAPRSLLAQAFSSYGQGNGDGHPPTRREIEVLSLLHHGLSNREIASRLGISERTVKSHVSNLLTKFRVKSRLELVVQFRSLVSTRNGDP